MRSMFWGAVLPLGLRTARRAIARNLSFPGSGRTACVTGSNRAAGRPRCDSTKRSPLAIRRRIPSAPFRNCNIVTVFIMLKFNLNFTQRQRNKKAYWLAARQQSRDDVDAIELLGARGWAVQVSRGRTGSGDDAAVGAEVGSEIGGSQDAVRFAGDARPGEQIAAGQTQDAQHRIGIQRVGAGDVFGGVAHAVAIVVRGRVEQNHTSAVRAERAFDTGIVYRAHPSIEGLAVGASRGFSRAGDSAIEDIGGARRSTDDNVITGNASFRIAQGGPTKGGRGADGVGFGRRWGARRGRRGNIVELEILRFERVGRPGAVGGRNFFEQHEQAIVEQIGPTDAVGDQQIGAAIPVNGGIGGDVSHVVGAPALNAEQIRAVLGDVDVEVALLVVVPV